MKKNVSKRLTKVMVVMIVFTLLWSNCFAAIEAATTETVNTPATTNSTIILTSADYYADWGGEPTLSLGSSGEDVRQLQVMLNFCGMTPTYLAEDGVFGTATRNAVMYLQSYAGTRTFFNTSYQWTAISADGVVGPYTWGKINGMMAILSY